MPRSYGPRRPQSSHSRSQEELDDLVRRIKSDQTRPDNYRERSLKLHGWICAKCGREFDHTNIHLLTVHHRDGNHDYNPQDGSNWENLCIYCHEDEHGRFLLGDYLQGKK